MAKSQFLSIFRGLTGEVDEVTKNASATGPHNVHLRQLYSKLELLLLDMEESMIAANSKDSDTVDEKFLTMMQVHLRLNVYVYVSVHICICI
jgi:3-deoxy-D-arabino-heptulosonate 7-phosphate (DAHP) synthase class II